MAGYEFTNAPHWTSSNPMVRDIWRQIHIRAIQNQGRGFTFDYLMHRDEYRYRYNTGLFSSGWEKDLHYPRSNHPTSQGYYSDKQKQFEEARQVLLPYIRNYSYHTVQVEDSRTRTAKKGDTAWFNKEYYAKIQVLDVVSDSIYNYYETEGTAFKNRIRASQPTLMNKLTGLVHYDISAKVKYLPHGQNKFCISIAAESDRASCGSQKVLYKDHGLVPLSTLSQCYGLFLAMAEDVSKSAGRSGYDSAVIVLNLYASGGKFGVSGHVEISVETKQSLSQW